MRFEEFSETAPHAKPAQCPRCRASCLVLLFDSPAEGMVCPHCHEKLVVFRKDAVVPARNHNKRNRAVCPRCGNTTNILMFDSPLAGMVCTDCHEALAYFRQEVAGLIPEKT